MCLWVAVTNTKDFTVQLKKNVIFPTPPTNRPSRRWCVVGFFSVPVPPPPLSALLERFLILTVVLLLSEFGGIFFG